MNYRLATVTVLLLYLPVVIISGVFHLADGSVGLHQGIVSVDNITVAGLMLGFQIASMRVRYRILKFIFGGFMNLKQKRFDEL